MFLKKVPSIEYRDKNQVSRILYQVSGTKYPDTNFFSGKVKSIFLLKEIQH